MNAVALVMLSVLVPWEDSLPRYYWYPDTAFGGYCLVYDTVWSSTGEDGTVTEHPYRRQCGRIDWDAEEGWLFSKVANEWPEYLPPAPPHVVFEDPPCR